MSNISKELLTSFNKNIFIEAGTHKGGTVELALSCGFKKIYSCEPALARYEFCKDKFTKEIEQGIVYIEPKPSKDFFRDILPDIKEESVFWLDSHKDDNVSGLEKLPDCPIFDELKEIKKHEIKSHVILIDDIRIFRSGVGWGRAINLIDIEKELLSINKNYKISYRDGRVPNDILVCEL